MPLAVKGNEYQQPKCPKCRVNDLNKLGTHGFEVSKLGFGCMGLSTLYNDPLPKQDAISIIKYAFSKGITFFDTSDVYGASGNEFLVGK
ncbi:putative aldo-keto reductase 1, partial [Mucuna pruriens]